MGKKRNLLYCALMLLVVLTAHRAWEQEIHSREILAYSESMTLEERRVFMEELFKRGTKPAVAVEDVQANDAIRGDNYNRYVPHGVASTRDYYLFYGIPRPQSENDILLETITKYVVKAQQEDYEPLTKFLWDLLQWGICSTDSRLFEALHELVMDPTFPRSPKGEIARSSAIQCIGYIHVPESEAFLGRASTAKFWEQWPGMTRLSRKEKASRIHSNRCQAVYGIACLPLESAILLLEERLEGKPSTDSLYRRLLEAFDTLWQRKIGVYYPRTREQMMPWGGRGPMPDLFPEWLYGPGGKRIEKPFGDRPSDEEMKRRNEEALRRWNAMDDEDVEQSVNTKE